MNIGIYYSRYPKSDKPNEGFLYVDYPQWRNYPHELLAELQKLAGDGKAVVLCRDDETYQGDDMFSRYWLPDPEQVGYFKLIDEPIKIQAIFDKGYFRKPATFSSVNVPGLATLGRDKIAQYELFGELQPQTIAAHNDAEFREAVQHIASDLVVVKPPDLNGGRGVAIAPKAAMIEKFQTFGSDRLLVQQFIDSSKGAPGVSQTVHDLRLYVINGEAVFASVRTPKEGSLIANTSQGGSIAFYDVSEIPSEPLELAKKVDASMEQFGNRYYSVDFVNDSHRWYVIEINDRPGVPAQFQSPAVKQFHEKLAACIVGAADNPLNHPGGRA